MPHLGPNPKCRYEPWQGIKPATFHSVRWCPTKWATPVRAHMPNLTSFKCLYGFLSAVNKKWGLVAKLSYQKCIFVQDRKYNLHFMCFIISKTFYMYLLNSIKKWIWCWFYGSWIWKSKNGYIGSSISQWKLELIQLLSFLLQHTVLWTVQLACVIWKTESSGTTLLALRSFSTSALNKKWLKRIRETHMIWHFILF